MEANTVPDRQHDTKLGRSAASPPSKLKMADFVDIEKGAAILATPKAVSMSWRVKQWPMHLNDSLGDCTCASMAHHEHIACVYAGMPYDITDKDVSQMYQASGWKPGNPDTDNGWTLQEAAGWARTHRLGYRTSVYAYADCDVADDNACELAHWLFGGLYIGAGLPISAQAQYRQGVPWDVSTGPDAEVGSWGGHCMVRVNSVLHKHHTLVTWGGLQVCTEAWWDTYVDEAMALVPRDWEINMPNYLKKHNIVDFSKLDTLLSSVTTK